MRFAGASPEQRVGWADVSHLRKVELHGEVAGLESAGPSPATGRWYCRLTPQRTLVIGGTGDHDAARHPVDVTTQFAALRLAGPAARDTLARFCALDLRPAVTPPGRVRPGSVARTPGLVLCEAADRYLVLCRRGVRRVLVVGRRRTPARGCGGREPVGADA